MPTARVFRRLEDAAAEGERKALEPPPRAPPPAMLPGSEVGCGASGGLRGQERALLFAVGEVQEAILCRGLGDAAAAGAGPSSGLLLLLLSLLHPCRVLVFVVVVVVGASIAAAACS